MTEQETSAMRKRAHISEYADDEAFTSGSSDEESNLSVTSIGEHEHTQFSSKNNHKELITSDHLECWGCKFKFGKPLIPGKERGKDALWKCFVENKDLPINTLSQLIETVFNDEIYEPLIACHDAEIIPWCALGIAEHLLHHMLDAEIALNQGIRKLDDLDKMLNRKLESKHGEIDYRAVAATLKVQQQRILLLNNKVKLIAL